MWLKFNIKTSKPQVSRLSLIFFFYQNCLLCEVPKERNNVHMTAFKLKGTGPWEGSV